ncbi:beta-glucuronosyltransferase GlcAT14A-like isoform X2 [Euphorbia lathyris]|uniref:beta-glucuronosyltransferase GlcAT14A-like isoform X2 n=1 Tax=Euphorbia lathyris TaxID=212925 RepID=UPI003313B989
MRNSKPNMKNYDYSFWILSFTATLMVILMFLSSRPWFFKQEQIQIQTPLKNSIAVASKGKDYPPIIAYWICGTKGDSKRMIRLLKAIYHPRNHYLLQLDGDSSVHERKSLLGSVKSESLFASFGNVDVVGKSYGVNREGSSGLAAILHAAAVLLKLDKNWDWFINLSPLDYPILTQDGLAAILHAAAVLLKLNKNWDWFINLGPFDYPILTQDDLLHALSFLPRDVNFLHYFSKSDWEKRYNIDQVVIDPSLYLGKRSDLMYAVETRTKPNAFNIFGGSPWMILTRELTEYCIQGWENLPRKLLMYFNNVAFPLQFYFHTVICNSPEFQNKTSINTDLIRYISNTDYDQMVTSGAAFATPFKDGDSPMLNRIDESILNRSQPDGVVAGKWCSDLDMNDTNSCSSIGNGSISDIDSIKAGPNGRKLAFLLSQFQINAKFTNNPCYL